MKKVFLSYAREDSKKARKLYDELNRPKSIRVWFDKESLLPGVRWEAEIVKAIRESDYFLAILSHQAVSTRGFRHNEFKEAYDVMEKFPKGSIFLIPTRLEECKVPFRKMKGITYADLFPKWKDGVERLRLTLKTATPSAGKPGGGPAVRPKRQPRTRPQPGRGLKRFRGKNRPFLYQVGLADLGRGTKRIEKIARGLNRVQSQFHFTHERLVLPPRAFTTINKEPQLYVSRLPESFYEQVSPLDLDAVVCLTPRFLALEEGGWIYYNYIGSQSNVDPRVHFISYQDLEKHARAAGVSLDVALAFLITGELVDYFLDLDVHQKTRNCPMDFTGDHSELVGGLRAGTFCRFCSRTLDANKPLGKAFRAMIAWGRSTGSAHRN